MRRYMIFIWHWSIIEDHDSWRSSICDTPSFSYLFIWNAVHYELIVAEEEEVVTDSFSNTCSMIETFHKQVDDPEV